MSLDNDSDSVKNGIAITDTSESFERLSVYDFLAKQLARTPICTRSNFWLVLCQSAVKVLVAIHRGY